MGVPHITSFCWCMGLEVGSKCVGFLHLMSSLILLIVCSIFARSSGELIGTIEDMDHLYSTVYKIFVGGAIISAGHIVLALTLLVSVYKRKTVGLRIWVWVMSALCAAALVCIVVLCATHGFSASGSEIFLSFLEGVVFFGVLCYCILCVNSYYLMLRSAEDMEGPKTCY